MTPPPFTESVYFIRNLPPPPKKKSVKHRQINPLRLELKGDIGPEVVLHTIVLETVFDLNLKRRKAEKKGDDETEGGIRGGGGRSRRRNSRGGKILSERKGRREKKGGNKSLMRRNYGSDGEGLWWQISNKRIPGEPGSIHHCGSRLKSSGDASPLTSSQLKMKYGTNPPLCSRRGAAAWLKSNLALISAASLGRWLGSDSNPVPGEVALTPSHDTTETRHGLFVCFSLISAVTFSRPSNLAPMWWNEKRLKEEKKDRSHCDLCPEQTATKLDQPVVLRIFNLLIKKTSWNLPWGRWKSWPFNKIKDKI